MRRPLLYIILALIESYALLTSGAASPRLPLGDVAVGDLRFSAALILIALAVVAIPLTLGALSARWQAAVAWGAVPALAPVIAQAAVVTTPTAAVATLAAFGALGLLGWLLRFAPDELAR